VDRAPGGLGADRRARASGHACAKRYPRSGPCDQDWTEEIRPRRACVRETVPAVRVVQSG
jgi:hypothetical protein